MLGCSKNILMVLALFLSVKNATSQFVGNVFFSSQFNSGTLTNLQDQYVFNAVIGEPIIFKSLTDNLEVSSGFDFPIVITGLDEVTKENWEVEVYPTITRDKFTVKCSNTGNRSFNLEIFDLIGNRILLPEIAGRQFRDKVEVNMETVNSTGVYLVRLSSSNSTFSQTFRIVKIN